MSRFFATGGSDSESESGSDEEPVVRQQPAAVYTVGFRCISIRSAINERLFTIKINFSSAMKRRK